MKLETTDDGWASEYKPGQLIKVKRSWWKQLTFKGTLYSVHPFKQPKLNRTERFNQKRLTQRILKAFND